MLKETSQWRRLREAARKGKSTPCQYRFRNRETVACRTREEYNWWQNLEEAFTSGEIKPEELSIRDLYENFVTDTNGEPCGRRVMDAWRREERVQEDAVTTSAFAAISGQMVFSAVLEAWALPEFIGDRVTKTIPTQFLWGERLPGIGRIGDDAAEVGEGEAYPLVGLSQEYVETPATTKKGMIVPLTKEVIIADRTGVLLDRARSHSEALALTREKAILATVIGATGGKTYSRNGTAGIAVYGDNSGTHDWDNLVASNGLTDYNAIDAALLQFDSIDDPNTGEPIMVTPKQILVPRNIRTRAWQVLNATEVRRVESGAIYTTISGNPVSGLGTFELLSNSLVADVGSITTTWFIGDFQSAFAYMQVWPITSVQAPANSELEFTNDIVMRFKVSERGTPAVMEPRKVVKCTA